MKLKPSERIHEIQNSLYKEYLEDYPAQQGFVNEVMMLPAALVKYLDEQSEKKQYVINPASCQEQNCRVCGLPKSGHLANHNAI